jgi:hypothetical protein
LSRARTGGAADSGRAAGSARSSVPGGATHSAARGVVGQRVVERDGASRREWNESQNERERRATKQVSQGS